MISTRFLVFLLVVVTAFGQPKKPLTTDDLIQMKQGGFDEQMIVKAIEANGTGADTSVQGLLALKNAGLGDRVITAVLSASTTRGVDAANPDQPEIVPDEIGVYIVHDGHPQPLPVEVVNFKTSGIPAPGMRMKFNGTISGIKSSVQLMGSIELTLRCADGTAPTEYQLVPVEAKKDHREFTAGRMGFIGGATTGVDKVAIPVKFEKIGHNTYKAMVSGLKKGEYGLLAPGAGSASPLQTSSGKIYTFGILD